MPFSRYLQSNERDGQNTHEDDPDHHHFSSVVHFQLPNLIFNAPAVPPGGGAEALPAGLYPSSSSLSWFSASDGYSSPFLPSHPFHPSPSSPSTSSSPHSTSSAPFSISNPSPTYLDPSPDHHESHPNPPFPPQLPLSVPSALGLPIYSSSGFDLISLLARVVSRPYPKIYLGPVDLSCSFVVTDTRRFDAPIVYASPSFLKLTGYDEHEVLGRNCRFLQAPGGHIHRGQQRMHTSQDAVAHMRKNLVADKECQTSMINYRKDGSAFINMVSVIPLRGGVHNSPEEADDVVYHIGFQVDLTEQPKSILSKLKDGTYVVNYSDKPVPSAHIPTRDWRTSSMTMRGLSKDLRALLADSAFTSSFKLSTSTHASTAIALSNSPAEPIALDPYDGNKPLHMFVLDRSPDFLHVVSLKGAFLYVAPAIRHILGYDPDELVGRSLTEFCHPADRVPLMRELKEASSTPGPSLLTTNTTSSPTSSAATGGGSNDSSLQGPSGAVPRPVDLLFRIQAKGRGYVWVECRGRLHVEPGKGRKAIILSGRLRNMPHLDWGPVSRAGGLVTPTPSRQILSPPTSLPLTDVDDEPEERCPEREFWGLLNDTATFLYIGAAVRDMLGWGAGEVIGKPLADFVHGSSVQEVHLAIQVEMAKVLADVEAIESSGLACDVLTKEGNAIPVHIVLYRSRVQEGGASRGPGSVVDAAVGSGGDSGSRPPVVCQVKRCEGTIPPPANAVIHPLAGCVFEETDLDRSSSWQYELQQLKFKNQRLADEVASLEAGITKKIHRKQTSTTAPLGTSPGLTVGGRPLAGPRLSFGYVPHPQPPSGTHPPHPPGPMNFRFVSGTQGVPRSSPPQPPRAHQVPLSTAQPSESPIHPRPPMSHSSSSHMQSMCSPHGQQQQQQQIPSPLMPPPGYEHPVYMPPSMRQSTESSLQGWSFYHPAAPDRGFGPGGADPTGLPSLNNFSAMPMKRSWDNSLRDPGGGGA
uniref:White collar 1-like protein n=1 Tax=Ganoderma lucidum TaxID=5315 RepID=A0A023IY17_GANLU|nr:white collar 1-like protein [Ganoderma lucidum]